MNNKLQFYSELADQSTKKLTKSRENWTSYLNTAARLYKYPFDEQVMIYAQRPNATACATFETWNKPMNRLIKRGSNISEGKYRIFSYFLHEHSLQDKAKFLREEYGTGGSSHAIFGADNSHENHDYKGIELSRGSIMTPSDKIIIQWSRAARLIDVWINDGNYMTEIEMSRLPEYEKVILSRQIYNFYSVLPNDMYKPFSNELNYEEGTKTIRLLLDEPTQVATIFENMASICEVTTESDRYYNSRQKTFVDLKAFSDGTYTLFPQLTAIDSIVQNNSPFVELTQRKIQQISLFNLPTIEEQQKIINDNNIEPVPVIIPTISQEDIDQAIRNWNGNIESKITIYSYMCDPKDALAFDTAELLKEEYGDDLSAFVVTKDGAESVTLSWAKVQKRIWELMETGRFLTSEEQEIADVELDSSMDSSLGETLDTQEIQETEETPNIEAEINPSYAVGDTVYLENDRRFIIDSIK